MPLLLLLRLCENHFDPHQPKENVTKSAGKTRTHSLYHEYCYRFDWDYRTSFKTIHKTWKHSSSSSSSRFHSTTTLLYGTITTTDRRGTTQCLWCVGRLENVRNCCNNDTSLGTQNSNTDNPRVPSLAEECQCHAPAAPCWSDEIDMVYTTHGLLRSLSHSSSCCLCEIVE